MKGITKQLTPPRIIALGFALVILLGSVLLGLPCSVKPGVTLRYIDSLYTATSAVCVTGLIAVDAADTFTPFGQFILAALIQIGGLGVTSIGAGVILAMGKKVSFRERNIIKEASNLDSGKGIVRFIKNVFLMTLCFEVLGMILSYIVFSKDFPPLKALGVSAFHSIATFNNAGFDILGNFQSLIPYQNSLLLNIVTCGLIFFGGIGFLVIKELIQKRCNWKKLSMHTKAVLTMSLVLTVAGAVLIKLSEDVSWLGAIFFSFSARTAGFSTYSLGGFTNAGLMVIAVLMFIGASPGSTGGGIKTSTIFVLLQGIKSAATNKSEKAFKYAIPRVAFRKAAVITLMGIGIIITSTYLLLLFEPNLRFVDAFFEMTSAFGTVGLSTGITTSLGLSSKILSIFMMYIGRLGPLTIATLWYFTKGERVSHPEGNIAIG